MPRFRYRAFDRSGLILEGDVDAPSLLSVSEIVRAKGVTPFEVMRGDLAFEPWWKRDLFGSGRPKPAAIAALTRDLAILLQARIALSDALRVISKQTADRSAQRLAHGLWDDVTKGRALSEALSSSPGAFGEDYLSIVRAGEMSGSLGEVFSELAALYERRMALDAKIKSALVYPAVLALMSVFSVGVIAEVLVPSIAPIFIENGKELPPFIGFVMILHDNVSATFAIIAALSFLIVALHMLVKRSPRLRLRYDAGKLKVPILGPLVLQRETARFARTFGTLLKSGVPIMMAFTTAVTGVMNRQINTALTAAIDGVRHGRALSVALEQQDVLPPLALQMIVVGEESGQLDKILLRVASLFEELSAQRVDRLMTLLTPALTITVAGLVGTLIMSVMSAILSINDLASQ